MVKQLRFNVTFKEDRHITNSLFTCFMATINHKKWSSRIKPLWQARVMSSGGSVSNSEECPKVLFHPLFHTSTCQRAFTSWWEKNVTAHVHHCHQCIMPIHQTPSDWRHMESWSDECKVQLQRALWFFFLISLATQMPCHHHTKKKKKEKKWCKCRANQKMTGRREKTLQASSSVPSICK